MHWHSCRSCQVFCEGFFRHCSSPLPHVKVTPSPPPAAHFFLMRHIVWTPVGCHFHWGGVAALPAFNRDALTNRPRISLLDKASFILTLHIPQRLCMVMGRVNFFGGCADGILYLDVLCLIMPEPSACTHTYTHIQTHILRLDLSPASLTGRQLCIFLTAITHCDSYSGELKEYTHTLRRLIDPEQHNHCIIPPNASAAPY